VTKPARKASSKQFLLLGMVHALPLPGSPRAGVPLSRIILTAQREAQQIIDAGFDGVVVENMHDTPYVNAPHPPETVACMTRVTAAVRSVVPGAMLGIQILSTGHLEALAVAHACEAQFIRVENFAFAHVADEGLLANAAAGPLLRYRRSLGAEHIRVVCDIKKKHASHAITADLSVSDTAKGAAFFGADGLIVTGSHTGAPAAASDVREAAQATRLPVWVGSGGTPEQLDGLAAHAQGLIVGSFIKKGGRWEAPVDAARCRAMVRARDALAARA